MNELRPYMKFFNKNTKIYIILFLVMGAFLNVLPLIIVTFANLPKQDLSSFTTPLLNYISILIFVYGISIVNKDFSGALSIRADRKNCIKSIILTLIILAFVLSVISIVLIFLSKLSMELITGYNLDIVSLLKQDLLWISIPTIIESSTANMPLVYLNYFINLCISEICIGLIGALLGAFTYRVRKATSFTLLIGLPILILIYIVNFAIKHTQKMLTFLDKIITLFANPYILLGLKVGTIFVCITLIILLLRRAPIKDYANDLL